MTADVVIPNPDPAIGSRASLAHRPHFLGLDGMRGVAAFAVMLFHEFLIFPGVGKPLPAAVAVDLFFLLSGFVLAYAYGDKLDRGMGWAEFMGARLIRLYPMILLGVSLGAIVAFTKQAVQGQTGPGTDIIDLVGTLLMLPMALRFVAAQFPFDSPQAFLFDAPASWLAVKYYDEPVRRRLRSLLARREARRRLAAA